METTGCHKKWANLLVPYSSGLLFCHSGLRFPLFYFIYLSWVGMSLVLRKPLCTGLLFSRAALQVAIIST